ncbi:type I restriction modification DNA specificity domain protein [Acinetobacter baumannii]|uniref:restriction endonuclease subunit S n=1 Tax=Acinetobacter calcoaceticus/baumannii complex TaxID=909768 RepID=UPI00066E4363|nr:MULTISPECIES: restriction endonuclease subunit S [Acinetobacter calcoaceticus/baumannii complex]EHU2485244.1 restriction endonuclease subunit S [Acinetobacter baumannii]KMV05684.1 type I restriction modification DNA specificity domain protein [Acinetobacter baumannii]MBR7724042.1 restriction endonuclease subunit S [Acinetobacter nosocomialis]MDO7445083.1 restriction endonuclease subunit S [Acinetobacter baumannii]UAB16705.1 restriction endonuclease subunit S [Acinetobacter baumannii]
MNWEQRPLDEVIEYFIDYRGKTPRKTTHGIPLITAKIVKEGRLLDANEFIALEDYDNWMTRGYPEIDDIVLTTEAPLGEVALIKDKNVALAQRIITLRGYKDRLDNRFLKYWFQSEYGQYELDARASGTTVFGIKASVLKKMLVPVPCLHEQKTIASVLSSLDDKIDLLHRQNKTLEEMAETLFRQWFIEEVKEDWKLGTLEHLIDLKYGKALKQEDRSGSGYPVVASSGVVGFHNEYLVEGPGIVIGRKGTLGKVYFMEDSFYPIDTSYFIKTKIPESNLLFEYYLLKSSDFANMNSDSAVPGLNRNLALGTPVQIPPLERIAEFNKLAKPWFSKIYTNTKQIQTLEKIRDTLLPKLMSGEVRVEYKKVDAA